MGRIQRGARVRLETVVGQVDAHLNADGTVTLRNVASHRSAAHVPVEAPGIGRVYGDIAWGGNWFFLCGGHGQALTLDRVDELTEFTWRIRQSLEAHGITGDDGGVIDHIELFGHPTVEGADSKSFVLCPGKAYDRSPCGTGTSAKLPASTPTANCNPARSGVRKASPVRPSTAASPWPAASSTRKSRAPPTSTPRPTWCSTNAIPSARSEERRVGK